MKKIKLKTLYLIGIITIGLIGLGIGSTYAMFTTSIEIDNPISLSTTLTSESDIIETIEVVVDTKSNKEVPITINNSSNSNLNYAVWYMSSDDNIEVGTNLSNSDSSSSSSNISSNTSKKVYIQLRNNANSSITVTLGVSSSTSNIVLSSSMTLVPNTELVFGKNLVEYITNLYNNNNKTEVTNNSGSLSRIITYNYAKDVNLMNDRQGNKTADINSGNIRYYGASPKNYIYFNCDDYNNQTSSTCELWRIIGIFDGKVKIMKNGSIGKYSWDTSASTVNRGRGTGDWSQADLMKLLNPNYENNIDLNNLGKNITVNNSLYWNRKSGTCYSADENNTSSCDFSNNGIKENTKSLIKDETYNLGGWSTAQVLPHVIYTYERSGNVYQNGKTKWTGKIALPYASDYGYAVDISLCGDTDIYNYNNSNCTANNWMKNIITSSPPGYLLTTGTGGPSSTWYVIGTGQGYVGYTYSSYGVVPVLFLKPELTILSKEDSDYGSNTNPYQLTISSNSSGIENSLPSEYQKIEYIGSTGTQYIETSINCGYNDTIKMESTGNFNFSSNNGFWQGANGYLQHKFTSSSVSDGNSTLTFSDNDTITVLYDGTNHTETITVGSTGNSITRSWSGSSSYGGNVVFLKMSDKTNIYSSTGVTSHLKRGRVYVNGVLTLDLIPAIRKSDNVAGMYDIINDNFYTNSGTGTFTVGSNVNS